jgi:hypothetical protein
MPSAYFRGDTHYRISVKREGKLDFYVIPSRDRILTDELHVLTVYSRITDTFLVRNGYDVAIEMFDGNPKYSYVNISEVGKCEGSRQVENVKKLFKQSEENFKKITQAIKEEKEKIKAAFELKKKIRAYINEYYSRPYSEKHELADKEMRTWCEERERELVAIEPYVNIMNHYSAYRSNVFAALETIKTMALYNKEDSKEAIKLFSVYLDFKALLGHNGLEMNILTEDGFSGFPFSSFYLHRNLCFSPSDDIRLFEQRRSEILNATR